MKKALIIMSALVILSLGGGTAASVMMRVQAEEIIITEEVQYGDKSIVEGVKAELRFEYQDRWKWEVKYTLGNSPKIQVDCFEEYFEEDYTYYTYFEQDGRVTAEEKAFAEKIAQVLLSNNQGAEVTSIYENPIEIHRDGGNRIYCYYRGRQEGEYTLGHIALMSKCVGNKGFFIVLENESDHGGYKDEITEVSMELYTFAIDQEKKQIDTGSIETCFSIPVQERVVSFYISADESKILLFSNETSNDNKENTSLYMRVIDLSTMKELQKIELGHKKMYACWSYEDFIIIGTDEEEIILFSKADNDEYQMEFAFKVPSKYVEKGMFTADAFDWDGERLLMAGYLGYSEGRCGMYISVYDKTGLLYHANYKNSVDIGDGECLPNKKPISISWN